MVYERSGIRRVRGVVFARAAAVNVHRCPLEHSVLSERRGRIRAICNGTTMGRIAFESVAQTCPRCSAIGGLTGEGGIPFVSVFSTIGRTTGRGWQTLV